VDDRPSTWQVAGALWSVHPVRCPAERHACSPARSAAVTVICGAFSGSGGGHLRVYSTQPGEVLWDFDTEREFPAVNGMPAHGGSIDVGGPVVVDGRVLVGSGYPQGGGAPGNALLAFSVDGHQSPRVPVSPLQRAYRPPLHGRSRDPGTPPQHVSSACRARARQ
jgi:hypothetical protein